MARCISSPSWSHDTLPGLSLLLFFIWILGVSSSSSCADLKPANSHLSKGGLSSSLPQVTTSVEKKTGEHQQMKSNSTLAQSKPKGQEHWNTLAQSVDLKTGAGDHAIKSVHSYSSCRNCFSSHIDRERSQVKFYGPFS